MYVNIFALPYARVPTPLAGYLFQEPCRGIAVECAECVGESLAAVQPVDGLQGFPK